MVMLVKRTMIVAKTETTYGTDSTPGVTDILEAFDVDIKEIVEAVERPIQGRSISTFASVAGSKSVDLTFKIEVKGSGSVALAPRLDPILKACGLAATVNSGTSVSYAPVSSSFSSCTIYVYKDGRLHIVTGCRGSLKVTCEAGKTAVLEVSMKGLYAMPTSSALITGTYETTVPPVCKATTFTFNAKSTLIVGKMELDLANTLTSRPNLSATYSVAGFEITGRAPTLSIDAESQIETSYMFRSDLLATPRAVTYAIGSVAGNICTITVNKFNISEVAYGDKDGILIESLKGECAQNTTAGDDELTVVFS